MVSERIKTLKHICFKKENMRFFTIYYCILSVLITPNVLLAQNQTDIDTAAIDALRRLESVLNAETSGINSGNLNISGTPVPPAQVTRGGAQPRWVDDPYNLYNRNHFIAAVGSAPNRNEAEAKALAALAALFGQSIQSEFTMTTMYSEAVNKGVVRVSGNTNVSNRIITAASMDNLIGAEIGSIWESRRGAVYAVAYMDKAKTIAIYTDMIILNNRNIEQLTAMSDAQKNTLDGYARFRLASGIAGINTNYAAVISQAGGSAASLVPRSAEYYNLEAANVIRNITVDIKVTNDRANRIQDAFAKVLNAEGLRTRGNNPAYTLIVNVETSEVTFPGNNFIFCNAEVSANLIENSTAASLISFSFNDRVGHNTYANAETAVFINIERIIAQRYPNVLREYLASLIPVTN